MKIILLLSCLVTPFDKPAAKNRDTCKVYQIPIDTPFREITWYTVFYNNFIKNDTSDYQLICISVPFDDAAGHVLYYKSDNDTGVSEMGSAGSIKKSIFNYKENSFFEKK